MTDHSAEVPFDEEQSSQYFYRLLGEMHHSYTAVEHELTCAVFFCVTRFEKADSAVMAMLGGQRMSPLKDTIKRLLRVTSAEHDRIKYVDTIFRQLGELQFFRDRLTHYLTVISDYNPECWVNMNFTGIKEREKMEDIHFNLFALYAAACDLRAIRSLVEPIFSYRGEERDTTLPTIPDWQFSPAMLKRDHPISRQKRRTKTKA